MAGGKKKSLANKLAKMSDEERARYLQHKADMEEEAKRRKEQLIATFMKKKIKKEDAFSRLNLAKINQNWHQILRKAKCQEMKEEVGHLRVWIERLLDYKNRTISKLMEELEEAEEQYSNNYQYHSTHIDNIIDNQHKYIEKLQKEHDEDLFELLEATEEETAMISKNAQTAEEHLKTVLYGQKTEGERSLREQYESYMTQIYETESSFQFKLSQTRHKHEEASAALWRQIAGVVRLYVQQTDSRRMHFAELRRLDTESAVEIAANEERIRKEEELIEILKKDHESMLPERELRIKDLETQLDDLNKTFLKMKQNLQRDLQGDEKKLNFLTDCATNSLRYLEKLAKKGEQLKYLAKTCKKFETEREKITKYLPISDGISKYDGEEFDLQDNIKIISEHLKDALEFGGTLGAVEVTAWPILKFPDTDIPRKKSGRPRTGTSDGVPKSAHSIATTTPESRRITTVKKVTVQAKGSQERESPSPGSASSEGGSSTSGETSSRNILERCFESLRNMENFWFTFNKVEMDYMEIKEEKRVLENENKQLRGMIRAVLEAAALSQTIPNSRVSTRLPSKRRSAYSAPLRRVLFS